MRLALVDRQWLLAGGSWSESASEWRWDGLELAVGRRECQRPVTELAAILRRRVELVRQGGWEVSSLSCRFLYLHSGVPMASLAECVAGLIELAGQLDVGVVHVPGLVGEEGEWSGWQNCLQNWQTVAERHNVRLACEWLGEPPGCWENQPASFAGIAYDLGKPSGSGRRCRGRVADTGRPIVADSAQGSHTQPTGSVATAGRRMSATDRAGAIAAEHFLPGLAGAGSTGSGVR
jgi:hypothetical protein